jgi:tRNA pseudouridine55 synthase
LLDADKVYEATVELGVETDTYDHTGKVVATSTDGPVAGAALEDALVPFRGVISQLPPAYAAIKVQGRPLYDYARKGEEAPRLPRQVTIHELAMTDYTWPQARLFVRCSKGTYIRSLAHDLGVVLGCGAHLSALRRIRSGPFDLAEAVPSAALSGGPRPGLLDVARALGHWPTRVLSDDGCLAITQGKRVPADLSSLAPGTLLRLLREDGSLLAVARAEVAPEAGSATAPTRLKPERVFLENARSNETKALNPSRFV